MNRRPPKVTIHNRQKRLRPDLPWLRKVAARALPCCLAEQKTADGQPPLLCALEEVDILIVSDPEIGVVHGEFLGDPTPTDVITFHHGEILVSADTAERQSAEFGQSWLMELALYMVHGLLHLAGWDDHDPEEAARMSEIQQRILAESVAALREAGAR